VHKTETARVNGMEMDCGVFGEGKKVFVILPGVSVQKVTRNIAAVERMFRCFEEDYTVYLFDRRSDPPEEYGIPAMAEDTYAAMRSLGIEKADIYGTSQGGMMGLCLAVEHPELVEHLVLGSSAGRIYPVFEKVFSGWLTLAEEKKRRELAGSMAFLMFSDAILSRHGDYLTSLGDTYTDEELRHFLTVARGFRGFDITPRLSEIKSKVYVFCSANDPVVTTEASLELAQKLQCDLRVYPPRYRHAVYDEAPDVVASILTYLRNN